MCIGLYSDLYLKLPYSFSFLWSAIYPVTVLLHFLDIFSIVIFLST